MRRFYPCLVILGALIVSFVLIQPLKAEHPVKQYMESMCWFWHYSGHDYEGNADDPAICRRCIQLGWNRNFTELVCRRWENIGVSTPTSLEDCRAKACDGSQCDGRIGSGDRRGERRFSVPISRPRTTTIPLPPAPPTPAPTPKPTSPDNINIGGSGGFGVTAGICAAPLCNSDRRGCGEQCFNLPNGSSVCGLCIEVGIGETCPQGSSRAGQEGICRN